MIQRGLIDVRAKQNTIVIVQVLGEHRRENIYF